MISHKWFSAGFLTSLFHISIVFSRNSCHQLISMYSYWSQAWMLNHWALFRISLLYKPQYSSAFYSAKSYSSHILVYGLDSIRKIYSTLFSACSSSSLFHFPPISFFTWLSPICVSLSFWLDLLSSLIVCVPGEGLMVEFLGVFGLV